MPEIKLVTPVEKEKMKTQQYLQVKGCPPIDVILHTKVNFTDDCIIHVELLQFIIILKNTFMRNFSCHYLFEVCMTVIF